MISVVTVVRDRARHLQNLVASLDRGARRPDEMVLVDLGSSDDPVGAVEAVRPGFEVRWCRPDAVAGLPLAAARNMGAAVAVGDQLLFCDVDDIVGPDTITAYHRAIPAGGLVCGPVRWLERAWDHGLDLAAPGVDPGVDAVLRARSNPHPVRPVIAPGAEVLDDRHELFWSLVFGIARDEWERLGGFDESFVGYGAEDTDLGFTARAAGLPMRWMGDGTVFHQWHPVSDPPVEHLASIVANARTFRAKWGRWPMEGWLGAFAADGLVTWDRPGDHLEVVASASPRRRLRVVSVPASHPYPRKVAPGAVDVAPDPTVPWWPHPALEPQWWDDHPAVDVVHVHFGFEHRRPDQLEAWCADLRRRGIGLVVTAHDLANPHTEDQTDHHARMGVLLDHADQVITLTPGAAAEVEARWGRRAVVVEHPHVAPLEPRARPGRRGRPDQSSGWRVGVNHQGFRTNHFAPAELLVPLARACRTHGAQLVVRADDHAPADRLAELAALASGGVEPGGVEPGGVGPGDVERGDVDAGDMAAGRFDLTVGPRLDDAQLLEHLGTLDVVVLPYRFGTHSGLVELAHDLGVAVLVPAVGHHGEQWDGVVTHRLTTAGRVDEAALTRALGWALAVRPEPADVGERRAQLARVQAAHLSIYERVAAGMLAGAGR